MTFYPSVYIAGTRTNSDGSSATPLAVTPTLTSGANMSVATTAAGTTFAAFPSQACRQLTISNGTGVTIEVQQGGSGVALPVFSGTYFTFFGLANASALAVRRLDQSTTPVTVIARWEA